MLVVEFFVVFEVAADEDFEEGICFGVACSEFLHGIEGDQVIEFEAGWDVDGCLDETEGNVTGLGAVGFLWGDGLEGLKEELIKLAIIMLAKPRLDVGRPEDMGGRTLYRQTSLQSPQPQYIAP